MDGRPGGAHRLNHGIAGEETRSTDGQRNARPMPLGGSDQNLVGAHGCEQRLADVGVVEIETIELLRGRSGREDLDPCPRVVGALATAPPPADARPGVQDVGDPEWIAAGANRVFLLG